MKDSLQREQTPYEILGLDRGASEAEIDQAFKQGLVKRGNVQKLMAAKNVLQRPAERALLDLFQYDPQVLARLEPNPLQDPSALDPAQRKETAAAWEKMLATAFPDAGIAHSLAVLWYWWVLNGEERQGTRDGADGPPLEEGWRRVIAYWAMLVSTDEYWQGQAGAEVGRTLRGQAVERLRNEFNDLGQKYRAKGDPAMADRYQGLELLLTTEVRTAKEVASAGLRTSRGRFACGLLLLEQLGLVDAVKRQVDAGLEKNPADQKLLALRNALSRNAPITTLIDTNKPQAALDAIAAREKEEISRLAHSFWEQRGRTGGSQDSDWKRAEREFRDKPEGKELSTLRARALHLLARQQVSLDKLEDALSSWESALKCQLDAELKSSILEEIVSSCQVRAAALQQRQPETAIAFLEMGLLLVDNEKLRLTLGEILAQRGITTINEAQKKLEAEKKGVTPEIMKMLEKGQADVKRAAELGSQRAKENVPIASQLIEQAKSGMLDIPQKARALLQQAYEAANAENLGLAITLLRQAIPAAGTKAQPELKKQLAQLLNRRAVENMNTAMPVIGRALEEHQPIIDKAVEDFLAGRSGTSGFLVRHAGWIIPLLLFIGVGLAQESSKEPGGPKLKVLGYVIITLTLVTPLLWVVVKWLSRQVASVGTFDRYGRFRSPCELCGKSADYTFKLPSGEHALCSSHAGELRKITNQAPLLDLSTAAALTAASSDLAEAYSLDSKSGNIRENFNNVKQLMERFKDSLLVAKAVEEFSKKAGR